jgi:hypothetical protein
MTRRPGPFRDALSEERSLIEQLTSGAEPNGPDPALELIEMRRRPNRAYDLEFADSSDLNGCRLGRDK